MPSAKVCIDASAVLAGLLGEINGGQFNYLCDYWQENDYELVTTAIFNAELASALRKHVYFKRLTAKEGDEAFEISASLPVRVVHDVSVNQLAWDMAKQYNLPTCYDTRYLAVAEIMQCPMWTNDRRLANSLRGKSSRVRYLGDYQGLKRLKNDRS